MAFCSLAHSPVNSVYFTASAAFCSSPSTISFSSVAPASVPVSRPSSMSPPTYLQDRTIATAAALKPQFNSGKKEENSSSSMCRKRPRLEEETIPEPEVEKEESSIKLEEMEKKKAKKPEEETLSIEELDREIRQRDINIMRITVQKVFSSLLENTYTVRIKQAGLEDKVSFRQFCSAVVRQYGMKINVFLSRIRLSSPAFAEAVFFGDVEEMEALMHSLLISEFPSLFSFH